MLLAKSKQGGNIWKEFKRKNSVFISSTEIASIFYLNKHKSKNQLWLQKRGLRPRQDFDSRATRHGRNWEPYAIRRFLDLSFEDEKDWVFCRPSAVKDPRDPVCFSPDLMIFHRELDILFGLEVKCPYTAPIPKRKEDIPPEYLFQAFCCLMVSRADSWFLSFYDTESGRATSFEISPDLDLWKRKTLPLVRAFLCEVSDSSVQGPPFKRKGKKEKEFSEYFRRRLLLVTRKREDLSD